MLFSRDSAGASGCLSVVRGRSSRGAGVVVWGLFILVTGVQSSAQVQFTDVTTSSGITFMNHHEMMIAGVIATDITGDGYLDLITSGGRCEGLDDQNLLMRNNKRGSLM